MGLSAILALITALEPTVVNMVVAIRNKSGGLSVLTILDEADAQLAANQKQVADWMTAHGKPPAA